MKLIKGDCLIELGNLPDKSVDMVLTDPPYGISFQSNMRTKTPKFRHIENDNNNMRFDTYPELYRILKDDTVAVIFCSFKNYADDVNELKKLFGIKNVIVWFKGGGGIGDLKCSLSTDYELAIVCHKGRCPIRGKRTGSVWSYKKVTPSRMVHPTEKPVDLLKALVEKFSDVGSVVLDPFMGGAVQELLVGKLEGSLSVWK